jgi:hypothetical protein
MSTEVPSPLHVDWGSSTGARVTIHCLHMGYVSRRLRLKSPPFRRIDGRRGRPHPQAELVRQIFFD